MNYSNHNLRADLQEWKNRLYRAPHGQFGYQLKYFFDKLDGNTKLISIITDSCRDHEYSRDELEKLANDTRKIRYDMVFESGRHQAAFCYQLLKYLIDFTGKHDLHRLTIFQVKDPQKNLIESYIAPIIYLLHDQLDESSSVIYLLERYKRRVEWFSRAKLLHTYSHAQKNYEQIFEDDLRSYLFDQGVEYPFSTPLSASGRSDIIGEIDTNDPLIVEIKIYDRKKKYGMDRLRDGFHQIVKYASDYNKDVGYLVIFNLDEKMELNFSFNQKEKIFPPSMTFNGKTFYFVDVNIGFEQSASKSGTIEQLEISETDLTKN